MGAHMSPPSARPPASSTGKNCTELGTRAAYQAALASDDLLTPSLSLDNDVHSLSKAYQRIDFTYREPTAPTSGPHIVALPGVPSEPHMLKAKGSSSVEV